MPLRNQLPSSSALFMFEAAARHLSFTAAGREFNVTQPAVSRMIARLEAHLNLRLFHRLPTGLELTEEGRLLYRAVSTGFQQIEIALDELRAKGGTAGIVTISVSSAFAMHWFMPRFDLFRQACPEIDLRFQLVHGEPVGPLDGVDFGIRYNRQPGADHHYWKLIDEIVLPVCSPAYLAAHGGLDDCADLSGHTLVHLSGPLRVPWRRFLAETGYPPPAESRDLTFSDYALVIQAAVKGQGIALGWWHVVANELHQQGLVRAGSREFRSGDSYYLVASGARPLRKSAILVRDWLLAEMAALDAPQYAPARGP